MKYKDVIARGNPSQSHWELNQLLLNLEGIEIKNVLDIGVHRGGSMRVWQQVFAPRLLIGIDSLLHDDAKKLEDCHLIEGKSQSMETFLKVKSVLGDKKLDFVFIDGGHLYDEVREDFSAYVSLVRDGGVIAFHDVMLNNIDFQCEVSRFWNGIKEEHRTITIWDGTPTGTGEGIIFL